MVLLELHTEYHMLDAANYVKEDWQSVLSKMHL